ncbi:MAG: DNA polymerase III subunit delta' [Deltaproteobacteria bacterium]|nr:DNA polymerase III subunit delta' [Deltaproteobacteria bacterium]
MFFRDIVGQERVIGFLRQALKHDQMPHALLFLGNAGVGRGSTAQALAQALNCEDRQADQDACGRCRSCRWFAGGGHPDFWQIGPEGEGAHPPIKIEQIRVLRRQVSFSPLAGSWRVVLLKPAESLNEEAANALLKTLEEPPEGNVFILTAVGERDLLPTIVSRCRRLTFGAIPQAVLIRELQQRRGLSPEQASLVAAINYGSLGQALEEDLEDLLARRNKAVSELEMLHRGSITEVLHWAEQGKKAVGLDRLVLLGRLWYRDLLALASGASPGQVVNQDCLEELARQQPQVTVPVILARLEALTRLQRQVRANLNVELALNNFSFQWRGEGLVPV